MADEEKIYIRIPVSTKFIITTFMAFAIALGSYPVANRVFPDVRNDPFTGTRGDGLEDRIDILELEVSGCQQRNSAHRERQAGEVAEIKARTFSNEYLIKQCMRITGQ